MNEFVFVPDKCVELYKKHFDEIKSGFTSEQIKGFCEWEANHDSD